MDSYRSYIHASRYARFVPEEHRRETWDETVDRYINYFKNRTDTKIRTDIPWDELREAIYNHDIMPSMRAMMTAGVALDRDAVAGYNCAFVTVDHSRVFDEILYILMCGTGVGFSVERQFINKLPEIEDEFYDTDTTIVVRDSKIGWATAYRQLISLLYRGDVPKWDTSRVRNAGERLKTFGGRASGPGPLEDLFLFTINTFKSAKGRRLNSIECHDIICKIADVVICGGVRRCCPADTPVFTVDGVKAIQDIQAGDVIVTGGVTATVLNAGYSGKKETLIIKHRFGQLECTPEHRVAVFNSITKYEFKAAKDIVEGDRLVWDSVGYDGTLQNLPELDGTGHFNSKSVTIPPLTTDVAWLIGLIHGDGCINGQGIEISGHIKDLHILNRAQHILELDFGLTGVECGPDGRGGQGARLRVRSADLGRWMLQYVKQSNTSIVIPAFIQNSFRDIRFAYLAGVLDSDGHIRPKDKVISQCTTIYKEFANQIVTLLASLGIAAPQLFNSVDKRRTKGVDAKDHWNIKIAGRTNRTTYIQGVGPFSDKIKKSNISDFPCGGTVDFSFPISWTGITHGYRIHSNINVATLRYDLPLLPTPVTGIETGRITDTYDIEVEGIEQFTANGLVVHNSALLSLSNLTDERMQKAKHGDWWNAEPQRALANNSVCYTEKPDMGIFMREWQSLYESKSGERGIFNRVAAQKMCPERRDNTHAFGTNPCSEIVLRSKQFCNLSEVVVRPTDTLNQLKDKVRLATIIGTLQAMITDFRYISAAWKKNTEEERLLGVSLTGIMDHKILSDYTSPSIMKYLQSMREVAVEVNKEFAEKLGIPQAAAITCTKPSGCTSLDTQIKTEFGVMSMSEIFFKLSMGTDLRKCLPGTWIEPDNTLYVYDENDDLQKITKLYVNGISDVFEIEDRAGNIYKFTGNHKLKTTNGWVRVDALSVSDEIISFNGIPELA